MAKIKITLLAVLVLGIQQSAFADTPTIRITAPKITYDNGFEISVLNHCKERGFIRPINPTRRKCKILGSLHNYSESNCNNENIVELFLKMPIFYFHIIIFI